MPQIFSFTNAIDLFLEMLSAERGVAKLTLAAYKSDLASFADFSLHQHKKQNCTDITQNDIRHYLQFLSQKHYDSRTISRKLSALRQFFLFLFTENHLKKNICEGIDFPSQAKKLPKTLTLHEVIQLIEQAAKKPTLDGMRVYTLLELLYATGMRVSELVSLKKEQILRNFSALLIIGKGNKERMVPLHESAQKALHDYLLCLKSKSPWVFPSSGESGHLTRQAFGQMLKKLAFESGLDPTRLSPHVIRHAFATHLLVGGVDLRSLQQLLGHADIATTQIYTHIDAGHLQKTLSDFHPLGNNNSGGNKTISLQKAQKI